MWEHTGQARPHFAIEPGAGQESVWDYPRPPALAPCSQLAVVTAAGSELARSSECVRVLETASPPQIYIPARDVRWSSLQLLSGHSFCEWKGVAQYWCLEADASRTAVAWTYPEPKAAFAALRDHVSFYPGRVQCTLDGEVVKAQAGGFYGGWITAAIVGPCKGEPGTGHW